MRESIQLLVDASHAKDYVLTNAHIKKCASNAEGLTITT